MSDMLANSNETEPIQVKAAETGTVGFRLRAVLSILAERERELLQVKGPCSLKVCRLHYAHSGPCDVQEPQP